MAKKILKVFSAMLAIFALVGLSSCNGGNTDVTGTLKLERSAKNKTFKDDGIEECEITKYTDGDTSNLRGLQSGITYTVRYLSIDTPESTAGYDKWGKAASLWNKELLSNAQKIVLEAEGSTPEFDTNGTRYLGYVWYMPKDSDTYRLYNLECVENGYSENNCAVTGKYYKYFQEAANKAKAAKLHIHGNEDDKYFPETITPVTLKDLTANASTYYNSAESIPTCVSFEAYVVSTGSGSFRTATVEQFDATSKTYHQYNVVVGYSGSRFYTITTLNSLIRFVGWTTGEGSIHGCQAMAGAKEDSFYCIRRQQNYYCPMNVNVTAATVEDGVLTITGKATINNVETNVTLTLNDNTVTQEVANEYVGKNVKAKAFATSTENKYTLNLLSDLTK